MHMCAMVGAPARVAVSRPVAYYSHTSHAAPFQASRRAALAQLVGAGMLLAGGPSSAASFNEAATRKAAQKAQLLEDTRARAEGRAPRQLAPADSSGEEAAGKAPAAKAPAAKEASSFNDAAVQRQTQKAALLAEARQKALASGASANGAKKK
jgi:hypothetical protein